MTYKDNGTMIELTNKDGSISFIPKDKTNSDYQAYLNKDKPQVEHFNSQLTNEPDKDVL